MISREQAIEVAWRNLRAKLPTADVAEVEARLIDGTWSVVFFRPTQEDYADSPNHWLILVGESGRAEWFDVL